ncbi:auxin efflux carrier [Limtongia smithiae]|uniref:auxin efflux carrier n=1 Tax=Limtongia smithiae TaxID=1125753 RepID=UPI0034CD4BCF
MTYFPFAVAADRTHDHPSYGQLAFLTFQAVVQVVLVCLLGFAAAHWRLLNPSMQKNISQLNVQIFTPCLIFVKLASAITADKLFALSVIPVLFVLTTGVSYFAGVLLGRINRLNRRESNFVIAMAVFANSNSLPVSLTIALAHTLPALRWLDDDTAERVASRGILYLLIFQQLGQMLRWSWGYNTLLAKDHASGPISPRSSFDTASVTSESASETVAHYISHNLDPDVTIESIAMNTKPLFPHDYDHQLFPTESSSAAAHSSLLSPPPHSPSPFYNSGDLHFNDSGTFASFNRSFRSKSFPVAWVHRVSASPVGQIAIAVFTKLNSYMNPPLWSMLLGLTVAIIRPLQHLIFETDGFIFNTFTQAVTETSGVAVPLILVVLGGNLYPDDSGLVESANFKKIVTASLISRMLLPSVVLLPVLAIIAKYVHVSIFDDPIFLVVLFLLTTAPPAIQLSQICQLNEVFEREMASILFWGYVVLTLPITMVMVVMSLEVLEWAGRLA